MELVQNKKIKMKTAFIDVSLNLIKKKKLEQQKNLKFMNRIKNGVLEEILKNQKKKTNIEFILFMIMNTIIIV